MKNRTNSWDDAMFQSTKIFANKRMSQVNASKKVLWNNCQDKLANKNSSQTKPIVKSIPKQLILALRSTKPIKKSPYEVNK